mgnify:CR=1 FL=1
MKLSMWIVYDWLQSYHPNAKINEGNLEITGVRYLSEELTLSRDYLYIGYSDQYIDKWSHNVICVNGTDLIVLDAPDIYVIFNEIQQMLEYYNSWETGILQGINEKKSLNDFLEMTVPVLKTGIAVSDLSHKVLGYAAYQGREEKLQLNKGYLEPDEVRIVNEQIQKNRTNHQPYVVQSSADRDLSFNLYSKAGNLMGCMISLGGGEGESTIFRVQLMEVFGRLLNLWFQLHEEEFPESTLFLDVLQMKETDPEAISIRMEGIGWGGSPRMQLFLFRSCSPVTLGIPFIIRFLESNYSGIHTMLYNEDYLMIVNYHDVDQDIFVTDLKKLQEQQSVFCGCSRLFTDLNHLNQNYLQAQFAAKYGVQQPGAVNYCEDYAVEYMQDRFRRSLEMDMASPALTRLQEYDRENGTDYYDTLYVYLTCERNQTLAARKLFIHRNSLVYRVSRIEALIGVDLDDEQERWYLLLSYFIREDYHRSTRFSYTHM